ncbi:hypothetical protein JOC25_000271 [Solibacillus kalamii]|nr:hypothetical protein [Solibacillus kalamii]MBM7663815.1 hypothetical protein [Solibacillus kalamii]
MNEVKRLQRYERFKMAKMETSIKLSLTFEVSGIFIFTLKANTHSINE